MPVAILTYFAVPLVPVEATIASKKTQPSIRARPGGGHNWQLQNRRQSLLPYNLFRSPSGLRGNDTYSTKPVSVV